MRDTGMRNERELYRMGIENIDWNKQVIFVPDSKTPEGRRMVPMSDRILTRLRERCGSVARRVGFSIQALSIRTSHHDGEAVS
ncbi:MAG TPA: hypothetical protein VII95_17700 [Terriglobales bacterium]|jgi:integrase